MTRDRSTLCDLCEDPIYETGRHHGWCKPCCESFRKYACWPGGGDQYAFEWAARRARRVLFARLRRQNRLKK